MDNRDWLNYIAKYREWKGRYGVANAVPMLAETIREEQDVGPGYAGAVAGTIAGVKKEWVPYEGPKGGQGWKNTETGTIVYQDEPPSGHQDAVEDVFGEPPRNVDKADATPYGEAHQRIHPEARQSVGAFLNNNKRHDVLLYHILGGSTDLYKMPQDEADYTDDAPDPNEVCGTCEYFYTGADGRSICSQIRGEVVEGGWCRLWQPMEDNDDDAA